MAAAKQSKRLPKGVTLRKDGRYMARFQYEGESYTLYGTDVDKLLLEVEDLKYEVRHGLYEKEQNILVDTWFHTWMEEYKKHQIKPTSYDLYNRTYDGHIKQYISKRKLKDVRPEHIQRIFNLEAKRVKQQTLTRINVILNGMFQQAYKNGIIQKNPVKRTTLPKLREDVERRVMTLEEQRIFLEYAKRTYYGDIFEVALSTGMRKGDADGKISLNQQKPSNHAGLRRFGPEKFLQRNNEFMKERPIFYKNPIKIEKDFSTWLRCFYYTTKAVITEYIYF